MTCTEEYKEHIEYTFHAFCVVVIRNAKYTALRAWSRKYKREISLEYLTEEKHHPLGTNDKCFQAPEPDEEYILNLCGDTVILNNGLLVQAASPVYRLRNRKCFTCPFTTVFHRRKSGKRYGRSRSATGYHIRKALRQLQAEMEGMAYEK